MAPFKIFKIPKKRTLQFHVLSRKKEYLKEKKKYLKEKKEYLKEKKEYLKEKKEYLKKKKEYLKEKKRISEKKTVSGLLTPFLIIRKGSKSSSAHQDTGEDRHESLSSNMHTSFY